MIAGGADLQLAEIESSRGEYVLAHNGWVMNADPLVNFAAEGTKVCHTGGAGQDLVQALLAACVTTPAFIDP